MTFVCGASGELGYDNQPSLRAAFFNYLRIGNHKNLQPIKAEVALEELAREPDDLRENLNEFETLIANSVDSVLIFPESPGSFAELGLFSAKPELAKKTLVASWTQYQGSSFITLGPTHHLATQSIYRPIPISIGKNIEEAFSQIASRLLGSSVDTKPRRRKRYDHSALKELTFRTQLAVIAELVAICGALTEPDFTDLLTYIFAPYDIDTVKKQLALLVAMGMIRRSHNSDLIAVVDAEPLVEFDAMDRTTLKARWRNSYNTHMPQMIRLIEGDFDE